VSLSFLSQLIDFADPVAGEKEAQKRPKDYQNEPQGTVAKPKGSAGRSGRYGFNLQAKLGLSDNKIRYNKISVSNSCFSSTTFILPHSRALYEASQ